MPWLGSDAWPFVPAGASTRRGSSARSSRSPTRSGTSGSSARWSCSQASWSRSRRRSSGGNRSGPEERRSRSRWSSSATLLVPATLLQVGLRDATEPWLLHERLDVPDRARRRPDPRRRQSLRPRLQRLGSRALLPGGGRAARPAAGRARPLRLLPGDRAERCGVAAPARPARRLPDLRHARDVRPPLRGLALSRSSDLEAADRRGLGREPARRARLLVRHGRRAGAARARPRLRACSCAAASSGRRPAWAWRCR